MEPTETRRVKNLGGFVGILKHILGEEETIKIMLDFSEDLP